MTAREHEPDQQPVDDVMAIADAVGVTRAPKPLHPAIRGHLTDANLDAVVSAWALAYAQPTCASCDDTGVVEATSWYSGASYQRPCPECGGSR